MSRLVVKVKVGSAFLILVALFAGSYAEAVQLSRHCAMATRQVLKLLPEKPFDRARLDQLYYPHLNRYVPPEEMVVLREKLSALVDQLWNDPVEGQPFQDYFKQMIGTREEFNNLIARDDLIFVMKLKLFNYREFRLRAMHHFWWGAEIHPGFIQAYALGPLNAFTAWNLQRFIQTEEERLPIDQPTQMRLNFANRRVAYDSNIYFMKARRDDPNARPQLFQELDQWLHQVLPDYRHVVISRVVAEAGEDIYRRRQQMPNMEPSFSAELTSADIKRLDRFSDLARNLRRAYDPSSEREIINDDYIVAEALASDVDYLFTRDHQLVLRMTADSDYVSLRQRVRLGPYFFNAADLSFPDPVKPGERRTLTLIDVNYPVGRWNEKPSEQQPKADREKTQGDEQKEARQPARDNRFNYGREDRTRTHDSGDSRQMPRPHRVQVQR